ncbi:hypothetical protein [uncultured Tateyamaria sp.]|uniref:hypothetical protein n=1 Tax=uncultured Tateyamaria sp. TaxID=455651 RepID=UPI0026087444|nr:hypothetical protein [uncultured Tateyamaria sp.]
MNDTKLELQPSAARIQELERTVRAQRDQIAHLKDEIKVLEEGQWVSDACGDDLWDSVFETQRPI